ncbi:MAG TPA: hypothetical protein VE954_33500 [Oligoflexus sp.]|uniref:hypothetical protein n=1 Tax=Oligoflexus sp. TaxID=1971216 RepID=UPI002D6D2EAA|nr:hypothetical protein [Oligoflexus sp.]HYX38044.1 hypothetical protein [Oligoflexus sp.]
MNKVLLLSCFISLTAHAGTGGGISTPPGRAGLANLLAQAIGLSGDGAMFRMMGTEPLPQEIVLQAETAAAPAVDPVTTVTIANENDESRSYRLTDGEVMNQFVLKDRRQMVRASRLR